MSGALTSALWGALASAGTVIGALIAIRLRPGLRLVALVMAFGAGALLAAAAYELVLEAAHAGGPWLTLGGLMLGGLAFYVGDRLIESRGGRKRPGEQLPSGSGQAVFLGSLMDGVPESAILGMTLAAGGQASVAFLAAVFLSNVPEAMSSATSMRLSGRGPWRILRPWLLLTCACAAAAALGYVIVVTTPAVDGALAQTFAAGAILTMLASTMFPEAYRHGGNEVGLMTVLGFAVAALLAGLDVRPR